MTDQREQIEVLGPVLKEEYVAARDQGEEIEGDFWDAFAARLIRRGVEVHRVIPDEDGGL